MESSSGDVFGATQGEETSLRRAGLNNSFCDNFAGFTDRFERSEQNYSRLSVLTPFYTTTDAF